MAMDVMHMRGVRLRVLIALIVMLATLPIFALHVVRLQSSSEEVVQRAYQQAGELAAAGVTAHEQMVMQARQLLEILSQIPAVRAGTLPDCDEILRAVQEGREWLSAVFVADRTGKGLCGGNELARSLNVGDRIHFKNARDSREFQFSDVLVGRITDARVVTATMPLFDARGEFQGAVGAGINLNWIDRVAAAASGTFGGIVIAFDRSGGIITYQPKIADGLTLEQIAATPQLQAIRNSTRTTFEAKDIEGVERLFSVAHISGSGATIAVGLNRAEVVGPIQAKFRSDLLFVLFVTFGSVAVALLVAEFGLMCGVWLLKSSARQLKAGKMGLRVRLPSFVVSELHDLAATYNAMTAEFERIAYLDRLTGLPNRRYLERHMSKREGRGGPAMAGRNAVLAIDIDGFKPVNDTHGHAVGDKVLAIIARRIASVADERGLLFRLGGDEFVAVVPLTKMQGRDNAALLAEDIRQAMEQPIELDERKFPIACSIGIALVPEDANTLAGGLVVADAALYEAKRTGRNRVVDRAPSIAAGMPDEGSYGAAGMELGAGQSASSRVRPS